MRKVRACYRTCLGRQYSSDGYGFPIQGHEFDHEGLFFGMDMYDCADIPCAQVFPCIAANGGSEDDLLVFSKLCGNSNSLPVSVPD